MTTLTSSNSGALLDLPAGVPPYTYAVPGEAIMLGPKRVLARWCQRGWVTWRPQHLYLALSSSEVHGRYFIPHRHISWKCRKTSGLARISRGCAMQLLVARPLPFECCHILNGVGKKKKCTNRTETCQMVGHSTPSPSPDGDEDLRAFI